MNVNVETQLLINQDKQARQTQTYTITINCLFCY